MTTDDELRKAVDAWVDNNGEAGGLEASMRCAFDAVLPDHDRQLLEAFCDCESVFCDESCRACESFGGCLRAAALATPVEPPAVCPACGAAGLCIDDRGQPQPWIHQGRALQQETPEPPADEMPPNECWCPPGGLDTGCPFHGIDAPEPQQEEPCQRQN